MTTAPDQRLSSDLYPRAPLAAFDNKEREGFEDPIYKQLRPVFDLSIYSNRSVLIPVPLKWLHIKG